VEQLTQMPNWLAMIIGALLALPIGIIFGTMWERARKFKDEARPFVKKWDDKATERVELDPAYLPASFFVGHSLESNDEFEKRFLMEGIEVYTHLTKQEA